jgi:hypothetical protein
MPTPTPIIPDDPEIPMLVEQQIDLLAAIEAADSDDELMDLHAQQYTVARRIADWLDAAEAVTHA